MASVQKETMKSALAVNKATEMVMDVNTEKAMATEMAMDTAGETAMATAIAGATARETPQTIRITPPETKTVAAGDKTARTEQSNSLNLVYFPSKRCRHGTSFKFSVH